MPVAEQVSIEMGEANTVADTVAETAAIESPDSTTPATAVDSRSNGSSSSHFPVSLTVTVPQTKAAQAAVSAPRWKTPEFVVYYVVFAVAIPCMFLAPMRLSMRV
jgi:hypothetical protein